MKFKQLSLFYVLYGNCKQSSNLAVGTRVHSPTVKLLPKIGSSVTKSTYPSLLLHSRRIPLRTHDHYFPLFLKY
jgi:hypothetical protein